MHIQTGKALQDFVSDGFILVKNDIDGSTWLEKQGLLVKVVSSETSTKVVSSAAIDQIIDGVHFTHGSTPDIVHSIQPPVVMPPSPCLAPLASKKNIAILTSGGDSPGMNAAVRAITRYSLQKGCTPFAVHEGYEGLVKGKDFIKPLKWDSGGTCIGTARSKSFRTRQGRLEACFNMISNGIDALVVIGGDGSLTGADTLRSEWKSLVEELISTNRLSKIQCEGLEDLTIVGLVGSIDNDMCATDITIGAYTALHRICEALDSLTSTALSHQRAFVVEVMGRNCGWLALMAAISVFYILFKVGADWVFLPEHPPPIDTEKYNSDWETEMCERLGQNRKMGSRVTLVIVCEGAIDRNLKPIKSEYVKSVLETRLGTDTRVTTLGHVQRGGTPCAYDRYLGTVQGVEAVEAVLRATPETPAPMIGMRHHKITSTPLVDAVRLTHDVADAISKKDFKKAMDLRDPDFAAAYSRYIESHLISSGGHEDTLLPKDKRIRIGIIHIGAPAGGMNAATRTAARVCLNRGHTPLAIKNGFAGLVNGDVSPLTWHQVITWQAKGGSELGTNRDHPAPVSGVDATNLNIKIPGSVLIDCGRIAYSLQKLEIEALLIIGGFEAYTSLITLTEARSVYPAFCIPMIHLPATVSNNVPGTDFSIGSDTALNTIVESCDRIRQSATATQKRVFVVEIQGGNCGYLSVLGGLASGATTVYIPEEGISLDMISRDVHHLTNRYKYESQKRNGWNEGRVIFRAENSCSTYSTDVLCDILRKEGGGLFDSRAAILGHLQQGGIPSPLDRIRATRLAVDCVDWIQNTCNEIDFKGKEYPKYYTKESSHACVIGICGADIVYSEVLELLRDSDIRKRRWNNTWWMGLNNLVKVFSKYFYQE